MQVARVEGPLMYLWRPQRVVTIGRHQNPWKECMLAQMEQDGVSLARRRSGGGAVFQDPGCSVFTFIAPSSCFSIDRNLDIVIGALRRLGVEAEKKGRNDLTFQGRKISGSAFKHAPDRGVSLHHGTVLVDTDMRALQRYLTPDKRKLEAKGIASVGARVMNLREQFPTLDHDAICQAFLHEFSAVENNGKALPVEMVDEESVLAQQPELKAYRAELEDKEWRLGRTPDFSHKLETRIDGVAIFDVQMQVVGGKIEDIVVFSDALFPNVINEVMSALRGVEYGRRGIRQALEALRPMFHDEGPTKLLEAFHGWILSNVDN